MLNSMQLQRTTTSDPILKPGYLAQIIVTKEQKPQSALADHLAQIIAKEQKPQPVTPYSNATSDCVMIPEPEM